MKKEPKVSIIIVNYNGFEETINCLKSIAELNYDNFEIIVIDNDSSNDSFKEITKFLKEFSLNRKIELFKSNHNLGFAGGCNLGFRKVKNSEYFFFLNPDTEVENNSLKKLIEFAEKKEFKKKKIGFLGPRIFYQDKEKIYSNGGFVNAFLTKATLKDHGKTKKDIKEEKPFETSYVTGTALLVSRETIQAVGLMREEYFLYYEDADWSIRASKKGYIHVIVPTSIIYHKGYHSTEYLSFNYIYYLIRNGYYLAWLNGNFFQKFSVLIYSFYKASKQFFKLILPSKRKWIKPILRATWDFWRSKKGKLC